MRFSVSVVVFLSIASALRAEDRPNIVFFFSDDLTTQAISAYDYGQKLPPTRNIDRLAREGMLFQNSFCGNSICTPSRATVLTGVHSHVNGVVHLGGALDPDGPSWPKFLQSKGYATAVFGKWHLKTKPSGFDAWEVFSGQGSYYNPDLFGPEGMRRIEGHSTDVVTDLSLEWLEKRRDKSKPFCLLVHHKAPHRNWLPGPEELKLYHDIEFPEPPTLFDDYEGRPAASNHKMGIAEHMRPAQDLMLFRSEKEIQSTLGRLTPAQRKTFLAAFEKENEAFLANPLSGQALARWQYQRYMKNYLRCVAGVDRNVGRVLERLDQLDLAKNTIVVYAADQGFYLGEHGWYDKRWAYEESMRMAFIVRWPGKVKAGARAQAMVQNIDHAPTLLAACGYEPDWKVHGLSLLPILSNGGRTPEGWRDTIYYRYIDRGHGVARHQAIRTDTHKLLYFDAPRNAEEEKQRFELYDLVKDPQEMQNLAGDPAKAELLAAMKSRFEATRKFYGDTDEEIWAQGRRTRRYRDDSYIRKPRPRRRK